MAKDDAVIDYGYESGDDWEEEEGGEDVDGGDGEEDEEASADEDDMDGWLVGDDEEDERLAEGHAGGCLGDAGADGVKEEALNGMVVERAESVGDVETMMP